MTSRRCALLLAVLLAGRASAQGTDVFRTKRLVRQVSQDPFAGRGGSEADTQVEPDVALDPNDPSVIVAVFQQGRFDANGACVDPGFATSHDGGKTWVTGNLPGLTAAVGGAFERASDPAVAIGPDGAVYAQTLVLDVSDCRSGVAVQRSDDGGLTFQPPVLVQEDSPCSIFNDKNWLAVDTFPGSPHYGRLYSAWDRIDSGSAPIVLRFSDDRGATWSPLVTVSEPASAASAVGARPLVQPDGDLTIVYDAYVPPPERELAQTSHDGGAHFDPAVAIDTFEGQAVTGMRTGVDLPAAAADPISGRLYAVWSDGRFRSDGLNDIVMSASADGGASWTALQLVTEDAPFRLSNHFTPAVAAHGGTVLVAFRSRLEGSVRVDMRWVVSADAGATFGRERRLGRPADLTFAATAGGRAFLGDYMGLALSADAAHAVWCISSRPRLAAPQHQITWSATIRR